MAKGKNKKVPCGDIHNVTLSEGDLGLVAVLPSPRLLNDLGPPALRGGARGFARTRGCTIFVMNE